MPEEATVNLKFQVHEVELRTELTIGKDQTILVRQAKDGNTFEDSENIFREDFPDKK